MISETAKYFKIKPGTRTRHMHAKFGMIDLDRLPLEVAEKLHQDNWPFIKLTPEGEQKYESQDTKSNPVKRDYLVKEVVEMIKSAESAEKVNEFLALKPESSTVQKEASSKLKGFS